MHFSEIDRRTESILELLGYTVVIWNVDSDDWRLQATSVSNITSHVESMFPSRASCPSKSYVILDHDTLQPSVAAQQEIIINLKAKGYVFGNLSECLGGAAVYRDT
jgi:peptidoglycan/xylan/chitin deacetylase (PgdA/CDA1 family)